MSVAKTGPGPRDARTVAEASLRDWEEMLSRLAPVIGDSSFRVLFARSLHKTRYTFPWLAHDATPSAYPFVGLEDSLRERPGAHAENANRELRAAFVALLDDLIGKPLATRLLNTPPRPAR
ncbi:MAG: hypothetical protein H7Y14_03055 [Burkholderiales bacterium]|nr:hypothetical protein [Burkholderiales bacterium]